MGVLRVLGSRWVAVAVLAAVTGGQMVLVAVTNIVDYDTNYQFVRHVLAMDTTFRSPHLMGRAITSPGFATVVYDVIIGWEAATGLVLVAATLAWVGALVRGRGAETAAQLSSLGWVMWVLLFAGGFLTVGGEWFAMWESAKWNGEQSALRDFLQAAVGMVLVHLPSGQGSGPTKLGRAPAADSSVPMK